MTGVAPRYGLGSNTLASVAKVFEPLKSHSCATEEGSGHGWLHSRCSSRRHFEAGGSPLRAERAVEMRIPEPFVPHPRPNSRHGRRLPRLRLGTARSRTVLATEWLPKDRSSSGSSARALAVNAPSNNCCANCETPPRNPERFAKSPSAVYSLVATNPLRITFLSGCPCLIWVNVFCCLY